MTERNYRFNASASFRFLDLTDVQAGELETFIPAVRIGKHFKTTHKTGIIELSDSTLVEKIDTFRRSQAINPKNCDIFVSISSGNDTEIWDVPKLVNDLVRAIDCQLVFSFTCL